MGDPRSAQRARRGRVVMLVDNDVRGDSRVQKSARSAAAAGWEVILLGERRDSPEETWRIGDADVRLIPVRTPLTPHAKYFSRGLLRRPLAYPHGRTAGYQRALARARALDIRMRMAELAAARQAGGSRWSQLTGRALLLPRRAAVKIFAGWTRLRTRELERLKAARRDETALLNRLQIGLWRLLLGPRAWRRLDPSLWHWELAFGKVIDGLRPEIIHAHDFRMVGVGARAALRARAKGRPVKLIYDAHEYVPGLRPRQAEPHWLPALCAYEKEYARHADAVVTVSEDLADLLHREHKLPERPAVVMNATATAPADDERAVPPGDLRAMCGIGPDVPLLVYCGGITPVRGVDLMMSALSQLPEVHLALVSLHPSGNNGPADHARAQAEELGVADRVHLLAYVAHWQVSEFIAAANAAVSPLVHLPNHEIALSNKFFEYSQARLPLIVSDVRTMAEMVRSTGQGEVFRAGDVADYVRAVRAVLADPDRYREAYDRPGLLDGWTWEAQAAVLDEVYGKLLPDRPWPGDAGAAASVAPTTAGGRPDSGAVAESVRSAR